MEFNATTMISNTFSIWYNRHFAKLVKVEHLYGVKRRLWFPLPFVLYRDEYLDIEALTPSRSIAGGVMYSKENNFGYKDPKVSWWNTPAQVRKYCLTNNIDDAVNAMEKLIGFVPEPIPPLGETEVITNVQQERGLCKLRGHTRNGVTHK